MKDIHLSVHELGILMHSPSAASHLSLHDNFLEDSFLTPEQVLPFIYQGSLVAFQTGDGYFHLKLREGYPTEPKQYMLRLGVHVTDGVLYFRDLYDCYDWDPNCAEEQQVHLGNGYYHVTLCSDGDFSTNEVVIFVYLNQLEEMPSLDFRGNVPVLFG